MYKVDLNSDIGESFGAYKMGDDAAVMVAVTPARLVVTAVAAPVNPV